jgi:thioredoxin 1
MTIEHLSKDDFDSFIGKGITIVDFWASWCGPCQMLGPVFEELGNEYKSARFAKVNTEEEMELSAKFQIRSIPCMIAFRDGKEIGRILGSMPKEALKKNIDSLIK